MLNRTMDKKGVQKINNKKKIPKVKKVTIF